MANIAQLLTEHMAIWTAAESEKKSGRGRASTNAGSVYGVKKLRELILELAVRGKLVPQDANDESASELLKRIQAEKAKLIVEGKLKKEKLLASIGEDQKPFELPKGWEWVRFSEFVLSIMSGGTPSKNKPEYWNGSIPWASVKDLNVEKYLEKTEDYITEEGLFAGSKLANKGDLIICTRMGLGKIAIAAMDVAINQDLKSLKLTSLLSVDYFIKFYSTLKIAGSGMTVAGIRQEELLGYCVPLPSLAEQHRIVAKVDELMSLCDQLEQQHSNAQELHETLVSQLLATLTQSQNAAEFNANWQRIYAHFNVLFTTEASIDTLKQTLLQLAVMGKLVPQDPNDEPASELLKRIQAEKAKLIAEGKLKKEKPIEPISGDERFFELPNGWEWIRVGSLGNWGAGATPLRSITSYYGGSMPWFKSGELIADFIDTAEETVTDLALKKCSLRLNQPGDVLLAMYGATIGKASILKIAGTTNQAVCACTPNGSIFNRYLLLMLKAMKSNFVGQGAGGAQPNISREKIIATLTALPPLAEQHRIVAKVDALMALCDQLKTRIQQANQHQQKLADELVAQSLK